MKLKTSEILISYKQQDSLMEHWKSTEQAKENPDILDSGVTLPNKSFEVTLRIPWQLKGGTGHMLIGAELLFIKKKKHAALAILCHFTKPLIFSVFLGFLTSLVFLFPYAFFSGVHLIFPFLAGIAISGIYFGLFYLKIQKFSCQYLNELKNNFQ